MKIAIPTRNNEVDSHFGHCEMYTIMDVSADKKITKTETFLPPQGCGCKSELAQVLRNMGVTTMLAGNMGMGAVDKIITAGIDLYRGCSGDVTRVAEAFLNNRISDSGDTCTQHQHGYEHGHGHQCNH